MDYHAGRREERGRLTVGKRLACRIGAWLLALALIAVLVPEKGRAVLEGVYFTAANEKLMDLNSETMPFYSGGVLYVSSKLFDKTDLGVTYVYNSSTGLAMLYTPRTDLRFDVANQTTYDKNGNYYQAHAIDKGGNIFLPMGTVCGFFGLSWSISDESQTGIAPLIRVRSSSAILSDRDFIDAASGEMRRRYEAYEKQQSENTSDEEEDQPSYPVYSGQKIHLLVESQSREDTLAVMEELGQEAQAAFLLTTEQMEDGDLLRGLVAQGHAVVLLARGETEEEIEEQIVRGRELLWQAACAWLDLVWYEGTAQVGSLLEELGCLSVTADLDRRETGVSSASRARTLLGTVERYRRDLTILLGPDSGCLGGMDTLLAGLQGRECMVCAWRSAA